MIWERYREDYVQQGGKRWVKHSDKDIDKNLMGRDVGQLKFIGPDQEWKKLTINHRPKIQQIRVPQEIIDAGWNGPQSAVEYQGPFRSNGSGAHYYYDRNTGLVFQYAGYW